MFKTYQKFALRLPRSNFDWFVRVASYSQQRIATGRCFDLQLQHTTSQSPDLAPATAAAGCIGAGFVIDCIRPKPARCAWFQLRGAHSAELGSAVILRILGREDRSSARAVGFGASCTRLRSAPATAIRARLEYLDGGISRLPQEAEKLTVIWARVLPTRSTLRASSTAD